MSSAELGLALREQIREKHQACANADDELRNALVKKLNFARECGILLEEARETLHAKEFHELATSLALSHEAIKRYCLFSHKHPDPVEADDLARALHEVKVVLEASGGLSLPNGHGPQQLHEPNFFSFTSKHLVAWRTKWQREINRVPLEQWELPIVSQFVQQLEPIHQIYEAAKARLNGANGR